MHGTKVKNVYKKKGPMATGQIIKNNGIVL